MAPLTCAEFVELVTAYLDGAMEAQRAAAFEEHLAVCLGCETYLDQMRVTIERLGEIPVETLSPQAQRTLLDAFRDFPHR
jgi:anti-sigma factor RsiW